MRKFRVPRVYEQKVSLAGGSFRQLFIQSLGHDEPTMLLSNERRTAKTLITRYAQRMLIENALSDAMRFFPHGCIVFKRRTEDRLRHGPVGHRQRAIPDARQKNAQLGTMGL